MSKLRVHNMLVTLDGFATGEGQSLDAAFGHAHAEFQEWFGRIKLWRGLQPDGNFGPDEALAAAWGQGIGAEIMGRHKFQPVQGDWPDDGWAGWWGEEPPFRTPCFVMTHYPRDPLVLGETTSTSSRVRRPRCSRSHRRRPTDSTYASAAGQRSCGSSSRPGSWTTCTWSRCRWSSAVAYARSMDSRACTVSSASRPSRSLPASPTSSAPGASRHPPRYRWGQLGRPDLSNASRHLSAGLIHPWSLCTEICRTRGRP